jgi:hypothetical protein
MRQNYAGRIPQIIADSYFGDLLMFESHPQKIEKVIFKNNIVDGDPMQEKIFFEKFVVDGEWDLNYGNFNNERNYREMSDLVTFGHKVAESPSYEEYRRDLRNGIFLKDHNGIRMYSLDQVDEYFKYYHNLIRTMSRDGYVPKRNFPETKIDTDIGVAISRSGELFHFKTGHHRLAIAKLLNLDSVNVKVHLVHDLWSNKSTNVPPMKDELNQLRLRLITLREN